MGSLIQTVRTTTSLLLWSVLLLSWPLSPRPSLRLRLTLMPTTMVPTVMVPIPPTDTEATDMDTHMPTTERGPLRLSPRLMLMLCTDTTDMPAPMLMDTLPTATMERGPLMLSQRPRLMLTTVSTDMVPLLPTVTEAMDMDTHTPTDTTERDLLMLSQRLMPTMDTMDMPDPTSMVDTVPMVPTPDTTGDKFPAKEDSVQQSSRSSIANIIGQNCISRHSVPIYLV